MTAEIITGGGKRFRFLSSAAGSSQAMPLVVANHNRPPADSPTDGPGSFSPERPGRPSTSSKRSAETAKPGSRSHFFKSAEDTWVMPEKPLAQRSPASV